MRGLTPKIDLRFCDLTFSNRALTQPNFVNFGRVLKSTASVFLSPRKSRGRTSLEEEISMGTIHYRSIEANGLKISYREAGRTDAPTLLLLHGFPTAGHMFRDLIPLLD